MSRTTRALLSLALVLPMSLGASATLAQSPGPDAYPLDTEIALTQMAGTDVAADAGITALFGSDGSLSGSGGCNSYSAIWDSDGTTLSIGPIAPTFMACDPAIDALETQYLGLLQGAASWTLEGPAITIVSSNGSTLVYGNDIVTLAIVGEWLLSSFGGTPVPSGVIATAVFGADGTLTGSGGCNTFSGTYTANDTSLTISRLAVTSMFCETAGEIEPAYLDTLQATTGWSVVGETLTIEGTYPLVFDRGTAPTPTAATSAEPGSSTAPPTEPGTSTAPAGSIVGAWQMTEIASMTLPGGLLDIGITFAADGTFSGNGGCNDYSGGWSLSGTTIAITDLELGTGATCDPTTQSLEQTFFGFLPFLDSAEITDGNLSLAASVAGNIAFAFAPAN